MDIKQFATKFLKKDKLILILLVGVLLIIINIPTKKSNKTAKAVSVNEASAITTSDYIEQIRDELTELLSNTERVGKCKVAISVKNDGRSILHTEKDTKKELVNNADGQKSVSEEKISEDESVVYERVDSDSIPMISEKRMPEIQGVLIVAAGAGDASVCKNITEAAAAFLGISVNKIKVLKMEV